MRSYDGVNAIRNAKLRQSRKNSDFTNDEADTCAGSLPRRFLIRSMISAAQWAQQGSPVEFVARA